jgi:UDP-N-acetylmuramoylalanine--D-glutamate ligase
MFKPQIAVFLNLKPDPMDRHRTMEAYGAAKARIFENQDAGDFIVYNADDELVASLVSGAKSERLPFSRKKALVAGAYVRDGMIVFDGRDGKGPVSVLDIKELQIPGTHNLENALAAVAASFAAGVQPETIAETLRSFKGVEHRIEFVAEIDGVKFINDSKGTNPEASIKAIEAIGDGSGILLIAGGYDKGADFTDYIRAARGRAKKLLLLGATAEKIKDCALAEGFSPADIVKTGGMREAVRLGFGFAGPGDTVLLSPASASWDMYKDYEERGFHFKSSVAWLGTQK